MKCKYCGKDGKNAGGNAAHENSCKLNPDRITKERSPLAGAKKGCEPWNKGMKIGRHENWRDKFPDDVVFVENSKYARHSLKRRILEDNLIEYRCAICDIEPIWMNKPMPLILDHINGINNDNRLENLRFVCGHCDSQLPTYKSKNRGGGAKVANGT